MRWAWGERQKSLFAAVWGGGKQAAAGQSFAAVTRLRCVFQAKSPIIIEVSGLCPAEAVIALSAVTFIMRQRKSGFMP